MPSDDDDEGHYDNSSDDHNDVIVEELGKVVDEVLENLKDVAVRDVVESALRSGEGGEEFKENAEILLAMMDVDEQRRTHEEARQEQDRRATPEGGSVGRTRKARIFLEESEVVREFFLEGQVRSVLDVLEKVGVRSAIYTASIAESYTEEERARILASKAAHEVVYFAVHRVIVRGDLKRYFHAFYRYRLHKEDSVVDTFQAYIPPQKHSHNHHHQHIQHHQHEWEKVYRPSLLGFVEAEKDWNDIYGLGDFVGTLYRRLSPPMNYVNVLSNNLEIVNFKNQSKKHFPGLAMTLERDKVHDYYWVKANVDESWFSKKRHRIQNTVKPARLRLRWSEERDVEELVVKLGDDDDEDDEEDGNNNNNNNNDNDAISRELRRAVALVPTSDDVLFGEALRKADDDVGCSPESFRFVSLIMHKTNILRFFAQADPDLVAFANSVVPISKEERAEMVDDTVKNFILENSGIDSRGRDPREKEELCSNIIEAFGASQEGRKEDTRGGEPSFHHNHHHHHQHRHIAVTSKRASEDPFVAADSASKKKGSQKIAKR